MSEGAENIPQENEDTTASDTIVATEDPNVATVEEPQVVSDENASQTINTGNKDEHVGESNSVKSGDENLTNENGKEAENIIKEDEKPEDEKQKLPTPKKRSPEIDAATMELLQGLDNVKQDENAFLKLVKGNEGKSNSKLYAVMGIVILLLVFFLWPRRSPRSPYLPLPYMFNYQHKKLLTHYTDIPYHHQALVINGVPGIGKARGLYEFSNELNKTNRLPYIINFRQFSNKMTYIDFIMELHKFFISALSRLDDRPANLTQLKIDIPFIDFNTKISGSFANLAFNKLAESSFKILNQTNTPIDSVYNFLNLIDKTTKALGTVLMAIEPASFEPELEETKAAMRGFWAFALDFQRGGHSLPLIITGTNLLSDSSSIITKNIASFRIERIAGFDKETAKAVLVDTERAFRKRELNELWSAFGGVGGLYAGAHDRLIGGGSVKDAIAGVYANTQRELMAASVDGADKKALKRRSAFLRLLRKKGSVPIAGWEKEAAHFAAYGLISAASKVVVPASKAVEKAIPHILSNLK